MWTAAHGLFGGSKSWRNSVLGVAWYHVLGSVPTFLVRTSVEIGIESIYIQRESHFASTIIWTAPSDLH